MRVLMSFGFSFSGIFADVQKHLQKKEKNLTSLVLVAQNRDKVAVENGTISWNDPRDGEKKVEFEGEVILLQIPDTRGQEVVDLRPLIEEAQAQEPELAVLNGGTTLQQAILWGQGCKKIDLQRDGAVEVII